MPNSEDRNFDRPRIDASEITPNASDSFVVSDGPLMPATPVFIEVQAVFMCLRDDVKWFLVAQVNGTLSIAALSVRNGRAVWQLVEEDWIDELKVDERGVPIKSVTIECPICEKRSDVEFPGTLRLDEIYVNCAGCGYRIDDIDQVRVDGTEDDDEGSAGLR